MCVDFDNVLCISGERQNPQVQEGGRCYWRLGGAPTHPRTEGVPLPHQRLHIQSHRAASKDGERCAGVIPGTKHCSTTIYTQTNVLRVLLFRRAAGLTALLSFFVYRHIVCHALTTAVPGAQNGFILIRAPCYRYDLNMI